MKYDVNDVVSLKKKHVCGSYDWIILRTGAELKMKCAQCGREIMVLKIDLDKKIKAIKKNVE